MQRGGGTRTFAAAWFATALAVVASAAPASAAPTWLDPVTLGGAGESVAAGANAAGAAAIAWTTARPDPADPDRIVTAVRVARHEPGGGWSASEEVSGPGLEETALLPRVALDANGGAVAVWTEGDEGAARLDVRVAERAPRGSWSAPVTLGSDDRRSVRLALDPTGRATVTWLDTQGTRRLKARTRAPGGGWSPVTNLSETGETAGDHALAALPGGGAVAVWQETGRGIRASRLGADGTWEPGGPVAGSAIDASDPAVAVDPRGDVTAAWVQSAGDAVHAARRAAGAAGWAAPDVVAAGQLAVGTVDLAATSDGTVAAVWSDGVGPAAVLRSAAAPPGGPWGDSNLPGLAGATQVAGLVALDAGRVLLVARGAAGSAASILGTGRLWSALSPLTADTIADAAAAADAAGNAVVAWAAAGGVKASAYDAAGPRLDGLTVPGPGVAGAALDFSVTPVDAWSPVGPPAWSFGDGATAAGGGVTHAFARAGAFDVGVTATDAVGNATTARRTVIVAAPPGASGPPGGGGSPAPVVPAGDPPAVWFEYTFNARRNKTRTRLSLLSLTAIPAGSRVEVRCTGRGCPFKLKRLKPTGPRLKIHPLFTGRRLRPGTVIEVRVLKDGMTARLLRLTTRATRGPVLSERCLPPGRTAPVRCQS